MTNTSIIENISAAGESQLTHLISTFTAADAEYARSMARELTDRNFGRQVYVRGLIELSNYCKNDCYYCGIRCSNHKVERYRLSKEQILECCRRGYGYGFRTFVLQGGEDGWYMRPEEPAAAGATETAAPGVPDAHTAPVAPRLTPMEDIVSSIRSEFPDCAITLSLGELPTDTYRRLKAAGADRYLLRHETINPEHYRQLHPEKMSQENRLRCLRDLKSLGYQTGCGIMVGSPGQTPERIAQDLIYMRQFQPEMVGMGPFIPQQDTPFGGERPGSVELTLFLLSLVRLMLPRVLLPSTTALGTLSASGRVAGLNAGANVIMPNLSPREDRDKYRLYDHKAGVDDDALTQLTKIRAELAKAGYEMISARGDYRGL